MTKYTFDQICSDKNLWETWVGKDVCYGFDFDKTSFDARLEIMVNSATIKSEYKTKIGEFVLNNGEKVLTLTDHAFLSQGQNENTYECKAQDEDGNSYRVYWKIINISHS